MGLSHLWFLFALTIGLSFIPYARAPFQWMETFFHELSHGLLALLTFGRIRRIVLRFNGSGYCETQGGLLIPILLAGYAGAIFWGALIYLVGWSLREQGAAIQETFLGILICLILVTILFWVRDLRTLFILLVITLILSMPVMYASHFASFPYFIEFIGLYILRSAIMAPLNLIDGKHVGDGAMLADRTLIPEGIWIFLWVGLGIYTLYLLHLLNTAEGVMRLADWLR